MFHKRNGECLKGLLGRLAIAEERSSEHVDISIGTSKIENQRRKEMEKTWNSIFKNCGIIIKHASYT